MLERTSKKQLTVKSLSILSWKWFYNDWFKSTVELYSSSNNAILELRGKSGSKCSLLNNTKPIAKVTKWQPYLWWSAFDKYSIKLLCQSVASGLEVQCAWEDWSNQEGSTSIVQVTVWTTYK